MRDALAYIADIASIASFILTIVVYIRVKRIEDGFLRTIRLPDLTDQLRQYTAKLTDCYENFDKSSDKVRLELALCGETLRSIASKTIGQNKQKVISILLKVERYNVTNDGREGLFEVYIGITKVVAGLELEHKDEEVKPR